MISHFTRSFTTACVGCALLLLGCEEPQSSPDLPRVAIETQFGSITLEIDSVSAPVTAANFLRYVDDARLDSAHFYRVVTMDNQPNNEVRIEVVQGGLGNRMRDLRLDPIRHETTDSTGIRHLAGTISMARLQPGSASSEFFICVTDQPELDYGGRRNPDGHGFAAFGNVIEGMEVVRAIHDQPTDGQTLPNPVEILSVTRVED